jgi:hypothetical protein
LKTVEPLASVFTGTVTVDLKAVSAVPFTEFAHPENAVVDVPIEPELGTNVGLLV